LFGSTLDCLLLLQYKNTNETISGISIKACNILLALIFSYSIAQSDGQQTKNIHKHSEVGNNSTINSEGTVYQYDQKITVEIEIMITV